MIKLTIGEAMNASAALSQLPKMNAKAAYDLARIRDFLKAALKPAIEQQRTLIEEQGGSINAEGGITWPAPKPGETPPDVLYRKAWDELLAHEIDIDREPIKLPAILGADPARYPEIQPEILSMLEKIIVE